MEWPALAELARDAFPEDVIARAKELQSEIGSIGAYSHSQGVPFIRKNVARFIEGQSVVNPCCNPSQPPTTKSSPHTLPSRLPSRGSAVPPSRPEPRTHIPACFFFPERDGYPSDPNHVFLTAGASAGVTLLISALISSPKSGILIPIPQYPLYTATLAAHKGVGIPYHLDEEADWATSAPDIEAAIRKAVNEDGIEPKALVIINPGNPTGALLDEPTMQRLVRLCEQHDLVLLADEVYQSNLHARSTHPFTSFKKVVRALDSRVPLFSFHSISKGVTGECGRRGGYFECANVSDDILALLYKMVSVGLCPPLGGQVGVDCMVRPPRPADASYALWKSETDATHAALAQRTKTMAARLNTLEGVSCVDSPGALYLYPRIRLPAAAIEAARKAGKQPDTFYALELLDETGICVVPGSGFGQKEGQYHYRLTCLCPGVEEYVGALERFHRKFMERYGGL